MSSNVQTIKGFFPVSNGVRVLNLFAYQSKGLPGLEIVGMGKLSRPLKEKLVYLTRKQDIKLPLKRFVLCVDLQEFTGNEKITEDLRWLELPILLLFWTLGGILPFDQLEDCMASGKVMIDGSIICPQYHDHQINNIIGARTNPKLIAPGFINVPEDVYLLPLEDVIGESNGLGLQIPDIK